MKINFKSIRTEMDGEENIIEFNSKLEIDYEDEFKCLVFNENRNGISWYLSFKQPPEICENNISENCEKNISKNCDCE